MLRARDTRRQRDLRRVAFVVVATIFAVGSMIGHPTDPAAATNGDEVAFVEALNLVRAENGLPAFTVNEELSDLARGHAQVMADAGEIFHANPISGGFTGDWSKLGENVGVGAGVSVLVDAFVASPGHFANIIDPAFTEIGVGVVWRDTALYTTHRFLKPVNGAPTPSPATTTAAPPTTAPRSTSSAPVVPTVTTTTTTLPRLARPAISAARVMVLLDMLEQVGT